MPSPRRPSRRGNGQPDPLGPDSAAMAVGGAFADRPSPHFERGIVLDVDASRHVYRVALNSGRTMVMGRLRSHPSDAELLPVRTVVLVNFSLGLPYIHGVLPFESVQPGAEEAATRVTDTSGHGGEDPTLDRPYGANARAAGEPRDVLPGDFVRRSPDGAAVGALHGKVALLKGSPLAQVRAFGDTDTVEVIAGLMRLVTWMGEARYTNDDGKTSFVWRGGADQLSQTGADEERYTVRLDVGHSGDLIRLEVTRPDGRPRFTFHVSAEGRLSITAAGGINQTSGGSDADHHPQRFWGTRAVEVEGPSTERVADDAEATYEANRTTEVWTDDSRFVGQDAVDVVNRHATTSVGGKATLRIEGGWHTVTNADVNHEVDGGGSWRVVASKGDIVMEPTAGEFRVRTKNADKIVLGTEAAYHAARFEALEAVLHAIVDDLNAFKNTYDLHTHPVSGAVAGVTTNLVTPLSVDTSPIKSTIVRVG